ncbi:MAG TPA: tetratricopeptide repeat protein [Bryobacteraceae bacterium]|nr:tetratricopeptide repeat protein [Bryobacteraceae bacterium]HPT25222.1 tetratricopeptide repeat protein [Bryobacteraceae bacterium]
MAEAMGEALSAQGVGRVASDERRAAQVAMGVQPAARLTQATVLEIAINVDAGVAVFGEFAISGPDAGPRSLSVSSSVVDIRQMRRVATIEESGALEDLSRIQSRLAWKLIRSLRPGFAETEEDYIRTRPAVRLDAMENYIRGLLATDREQQLRYFATAARLAPGYSEPNLRLGLFQLERKDYRTAANFLTKVNSRATRFREAAFYLALCRYHLGDYQAARLALEQIAAEAPLNEVFNNLGVVQSRLDMEAALSSFGRAIQADPADPAAYFNTGYYLWRKGRFDEAKARFAEALERSPEDEAVEIMIERCEDRQGPQPGDPRTERQERLKTRYDESGWLMLKQMFAPKPEVH